MTDPEPSQAPAETGLASQTVDEEVARLKAAASANGNGPEPSPFDLNRVTLSNGIVLRIKPVNGMVQRRVAEAIPLPAVPMVEGAHGVEEENPNDPDYLDAMARAQDARLVRVNEALWTLGTTPEAIPEGCYGPLDGGWIDDLRVVGVELPEFGSALDRYRAWITLYALATQADSQAVWAAVIGKSGILDSEVQRAIEWFRGRAERPADPGAPAAAGDGDGDHLRADDPRDGARTRRAERRAR